MATDPFGTDPADRDPRERDLSRRSSGAAISPWLIIGGIALLAALAYVILAVG